MFNPNDQTIIDLTDVLNSDPNLASGLMVRLVDRNYQSNPPYIRMYISLDNCDNTSPRVIIDKASEIIIATLGVIAPNSEHQGEIKEGHQKDHLIGFIRDKLTFEEPTHLSLYDRALTICAYKEPFSIYFYKYSAEYSPIAFLEAIARHLEHREINF